MLNQFASKHLSLVSGAGGEDVGDAERLGVSCVW